MCNTANVRTMNNVNVSRPLWETSENDVDYCVYKTDLMFFVIKCLVLKRLLLQKKSTVDCRLLLNQNEQTKWGTKKCINIDF